MSRALAAIAAAALAAAIAAPAGASVSFPQADPNHDGFVTWPEAQRAFPRLRKIHFEKCDANSDGVIERNEFGLLTNFYWLNYVQSQ